jgi:probable HAF family extracellular repeat protein
MGFSKSFFCCSSFLLIASVLAQPTITDLGVLVGGTTSNAFDVNSDGSVVVGTSQSAEGNRAFRWTRLGGMVSLGTMDGFPTHAGGVNEHGTVVTGNNMNTNGGLSFRWTSAGGMQNLGTLPGGELSYGWGINGDGSVIVGYSYGPGRGYRWTAAGGMQNLGTLPGGSYSESRAVSSDGNVVAGYSTITFPGHAARWTQVTGWQDIGTLGGGHMSIAQGISGNGQVIVGESYLPGNWPGNAFRWTDGGGMQDLGPSSTAFDANWDGSIIVGKVQGWAMLWSSSTGMVDLNNWLPSQGVNLSGWQLTSAEAISPDGSAIAGSGVHNGIMRGWVVTGLPGSDTVNPSSFSLFRGMLVGGNLTSLTQSDNNRMVIQPGVVFSSQEAPVQLIVNGTSTSLAPTRLELTVEGHCTSASVTQSVALWNYDTQVYETLASQPASTTDSELMIIGILKHQFIGPNSELRARISFKAHAPTFAYPWQARVDRIKWRVME